MTTITYQVCNITGQITWAASEHFDELINTTYSLGKMEATEIAKLNHLSETAKILLSAIAGAIIQHLLDQEITAPEIFANGIFKDQPTPNL